MKDAAEIPSAQATGSDYGSWALHHRCRQREMERDEATDEEVRTY